MDSLFIPLSEAVGASVDQVKLISCLLVSYPLGSLFIRIPSSQPAIKHVFNICVTLFYFIPVLNLQGPFVQLLCDVLATYVIAATVKGPQMPWIVFGLMMGHLTVNQVIRAFSNVSYETFEITGPQMVLVTKLSTFAWNVWDGRRPVEDLDKWQMQMRVSTFPSLLEFLGFAFYFPGALVGPYLEYAAYKSLIDETLFQVSGPTPAETPRRRAVPDGRKRVAYRKMVTGLLFLGLFVLFGSTYNYGVVITDRFLEKSLLHRIISFQIYGVIERAKYYSIWILTEGASILTGHGFTGYSPSGKSLWEGAANVDVLLIEFAPSFKVLLDSWNMKTNVWLRECVYKRVTPKGKKPGFKSSMTTFATSAFWHGIAPGYYLTFLYGGFVQTAGRLCRANLRPLFFPASPVPTVQQNPSAGSVLKKGLEQQPSPLKKVYDITGIAATVMLMNYACAPFMLLTLKDSFEAWARLGWYGFWMVGICIVFFNFGGSAWLKGVQTRRIKRATGVSAPPPDGKAGSDDVSPHVVPPLDAAVAEVQKKLS
ncbi:MBOAT-domain-containing protein [Artomyces pyxidatus]|uniref:MBOAT-domain-containing protein n=1 Tax=Artomyces pyxidatus TaxID=48021 RepID=A0ACB8TL17_9AGAM|nr:MBOAT-domain-containing protein [Artomyces pyxidatus]